MYAPERWALPGCVRRRRDRRSVDALRDGPPPRAATPEEAALFCVGMDVKKTACGP